MEAELLEAIHHGLSAGRGNLGTNCSRGAGWHRAPCAVCVRGAGGGGCF